jgi:hypothetical protein
VVARVDAALAVPIAIFAATQRTRRWQDDDGRHIDIAINIDIDFRIGKDDVGAISLTASTTSLETQSSSCRVRRRLQANWSDWRVFCAKRELEEQA